MSSTAILLREKNRMDGKDTLNTLKKIFNELNYEYQIIDSNFNCWNENLSIEISVNNVIKTDIENSHEGLVIYVHEKNLYEDNQDFDWIREGLDNAVIFENISHGKNIFLEIVYRYIMKYPDDYLWIEWVEPEVGYTQNDIKKIYEYRYTDINKSWLSQKPYYCIE